jgi:hypothetical protein
MPEIFLLPVASSRLSIGLRLEHDNAHGLCGFDYLAGFSSVNSIRIGSPRVAPETSER